MYKHKSKSNAKQKQGASGSTSKGSTGQLAKWLEKREYGALAAKLSMEPELSRDERYAYGYALMQSGQVVPGLVAWGPLVGKYGSDFDDDCRLAARATLNSAEASLSKMPLAQLLPLFHVARTMAPESAAAALLRRDAFDALWSAGDSDSLRSLLKLMDSTKEPNNPAKRLNLAKIRWRLLNPKAIADAVQIHATYLSAAASYALTRTSVCPLGEALEALAEAFVQPLEAAGLDNVASVRTLARLETAAMLDVHDAALAQNLALPEGQLYAPGYLNQGERRDTEPFREWLKQLPAEVQASYTAAGYDILQYAAALGSDKNAARSISPTGSSSQSLFGRHLTLQLALALLKRADTEVTEDAALALMAFVAVDPDPLRDGINAGLLLVAADLMTPRSDKDRQRVPLICPLWNRAVTTILPGSVLSKEVKKLSDYFLIANLPRLLGGSQDWPELLRGLSPTIQDPILRQQVEQLLTRVDEAVAFFELLAKGKVKNTYAHIWQTKASANQILAFLALFSDAGRLTFGWHKAWNVKTVTRYYRILTDLVEDKTVNAKVPLAKYLADDILRSGEFHCRDLVLYTLTTVLRDLGYPTLPLPSVSAEPPAFPEQEWRRYLPLLDGGPFTVLGVNRHASKAEILAGTMARMRDRTLPLTDLRCAQTALFSRASRLVMEFLGFLEPMPQPTVAGETAVAPPFNPKALRLRGIWSQTLDARH